MSTTSLRSTVRRLFRNRGFSLINILGLAIGLAACLLIYLYVRYELGYDGYNDKASRIVRVTTIIHTPEADMHLAGTPPELAAALLKEWPELEASVRIGPGSFNIRQGREIVAAKDFCYSEPAIFDIFSFTFLEGTAQGGLSEPQSIVLTRGAAKTYLGAGPYLGKTLVCNGVNYRVTGVVEDRPENSDLPINALVSKKIYSPDVSWTQSDFDDYTFILFRKRPDIRRFNSVLTGLTAKYTQPELDRAGLKDYRFYFEAERLSDVHFSQGKLEDTPKENRQMPGIFSILAVFILLIALLNYINLSTAKALERAKEVAVRKVIGARPGSLVRQFLTESSLLIGIAWALAFCLVLICLPFFNRLLAIRLSFGGWQTVWFSVLLFPLTTLLAGGYPAFVLSRFSPVKALKGDREEGRGIGLRKALTVTQFVIALSMLAGAAVIYSQMRFVARQGPGADRAGITCINIPNDSIARLAAPALIQALRHEAGIGDISVGSGLPTEGNQMASTTLLSNGKKREIMLNYFYIDPKLIPMLHLHLEAGRNFSDSLGTDKQESFIVNQALVRAMGWKTGVGESMEGNGLKGKVIGVVRDFFFKSLHNAIEPMAMIYKTDPPLAVLLKTTPRQVPRLRELWRTYIPLQPFNYYFMEEDFARQYEKDRMIMTLFNVFTGLAVFICLIGLYGLVSLLVLRRTREIGIRKVLGATPARLVAMLTRDLVWLVGVAAVIALPLAGLGANKWLDSYAYHTGLSVWIFAGPLAVILFLTMTITGYRILRAALGNPVNSLRAE